MPELFPRSAAYDEAWVNENRMGPNVLWLAESLAERMTLEPGMRVMDLGCGKACSSVFLAREYGVEVWATDLWIKPTENWERIREAGLELPVSQSTPNAALLVGGGSAFPDPVACVRLQTSRFTLTPRPQPISRHEQAPNHIVGRKAAGVALRTKG